MTAGPFPGPASKLPLLIKIAVLAGVPLIVLLAYAVGFYGGWLAPLDAEQRMQRGRALATWFEEQLMAARDEPTSVLAGGAAEPRHRPSSSSIASRLEGVGLIDQEYHYLSWRGVPPEHDARSRDFGKSAWAVRLDGVNTRLIVRAGPDDRGQLALASFIVDSRGEERAFEALLPDRLLARAHVEVEFFDTAAWERLEGSTEEVAAAVDAGDGPGRVARVALRAPDGTVLGLSSIHAIDRSHAASRLRGNALAWSVVILLTLALVLFRWDRVAISGRGLLLAVACVLAGRALLLTARVPVRIMPHEWGSASFFGTSGWWGLAQSPADLLFTAVAVYAVCVALRNFAARLRVRHTAAAVGLAVSAALGTTGIAAWVVDCVARNSSLSLFAPLSLGGVGARALLGVALILTMLGAGELLALVWSLLARRRLVSKRRGSRVSVGVAVSLGLLVASLAMQQMNHRLALERLRSEYAPLVLDQTSHRSVALSAALRRVARSFEEQGWKAIPLSSRADFMAYYFWVTGELFLSGLQSSLGLYNPAGELVSHFGFEMPVLEETIAPMEESAEELVPTAGTFGTGAYVQRKMLHARLPVFEQGRFLGTVVGHVVDEPGNLAFLPSTRPYLAALGPGALHVSANLPAGQPHYVLYGAAGTVVLSTLIQPPAMEEALVQAFVLDGHVQVRSGGDRFEGFAAQDERHRLHLLLIRVPGALHNLAGFVRLLLLGAVVLLLISVIPKLARGRTVFDVVRSVRGSFYRKLLLALLLASTVPLIGLALFLRGYVEQRGIESLERSATEFAGAAQRVLDEFAMTQVEVGTDPDELLDDPTVDWLRNVVGQEIIVYENGLLRATSKRELFSSGLLLPRLDGEVHRRLGREGLPYLVVPTRLGPLLVPVAYMPLQGADPLRELVVAVPMVSQQQEAAQATGRVDEMILLSTVLLGALLAVVAAVVARTVARPVRELVGATARIASGNYETRLETSTRDEVADLVRGFNSMASSLATQRADLERRRDYMERLLQHATTGVISVDPRGHVVTLNPAARVLLSTKRGRPTIGEDLVAALRRADELAPLAEILARPAQEPGEPDEIDLERDGEPRRLRLVRIELPDPAGGVVGHLILLDDVTELMRANRLAAWAEMARAIAHEIKNPLTPIQLSTEHLRRLLHDRNVLPEPDVEACLDTVIKQVRTLYDIAGEFSAYAKLPTLKPEPSDPVAFMRAAVGPYRVANPDGVSFEESYEPAGPVAIDGKVLGRAVVNLIENALQAMPDGGKITVAVAPDDERDEVVLRVEDTGVGLSPEVRRRLFEPYFSTKSSGTGLGLAIARRAVEAHHGRIEVDSRPGRGTLFRIRLPRVA